MLCQVIDMSHTQLIAVSVAMYIADVSIVCSDPSLRIEPKNSTAKFVGLGCNGCCRPHFIVCVSIVMAPAVDMR